MIETAAVLCVVIGAIHSYLGERFILIRLFQSENVPHLFGDDYFTKRTLRFAWHITTVAWVGFAYILLAIPSGENDFAQTVLFTIGTVFLVSGVLSFGFTKGKHLSWIVFWVIAMLSYYAGNSG
ncbi:MAG: hypothetical protein ABW168_24365 [Sedimenticola sp.]